jgi:hypothetical protein
MDEWMGGWKGFSDGWMYVLFDWRRCQGVAHVSLLALGLLLAGYFGLNCCCLFACLFWFKERVAVRS